MFRCCFQYGYASRACRARKNTCKRRRDAVRKGGQLTNCSKIIDFSQFLSGDKHTKLKISKAVARGFQDVGFIYLQNHNIPQRDVDQMFSASARFFDMPQTQKDSFAWGMHGGSNSPGYTPYGVEKLTQSFNQAEIDELRATNPDMKEAFDVGLERICHGAENIWPGQMDEPMEQMKLVVQSFFEKCRQVQTEVMSAIALGLGLPETYFDRLIDDADNSLRCLHYPSVKAEVFEKNTASVRAGAHSDYGSYNPSLPHSYSGTRKAKRYRINHAPLPRCQRWPPSLLTGSRWPLRRCHAHRRHDRRQRRRHASPLVERHHQVDRPPRGSASNVTVERRDALFSTLQHSIFLQSEHEDRH